VQKHFGSKTIIIQQIFIDSPLFILSIWGTQRGKVHLFSTCKQIDSKEINKMCYECYEKVCIGNKFFVGANWRGGQTQYAD
jgi:hypothetical protein